MSMGYMATNPEGLQRWLEIHHHSQQKGAPGADATDDDHVREARDDSGADTVDARRSGPAGAALGHAPAARLISLARSSSCCPRPLTRSTGSSPRPSTAMSWSSSASTSQQQNQDCDSVSLKAMQSAHRTGSVLPNVTNGITILIWSGFPSNCRRRCGQRLRQKHGGATSPNQLSYASCWSARSRVPPAAAKQIALDLAGSLVGSLRSGRREFSTNKKLLADAMVSNARRGRKRYR